MKINGYLYTSAYCPYCIHVEKFLETNNIQVNKIDVSQDFNAKEKLIKIGGKSQVPCYVENNTPLYESLDIIERFKETIYDRAN